MTPNSRQWEFINVSKLIHKLGSFDLTYRRAAATQEVEQVIRGSVFQSLARPDPKLET